MIATRKVLIGVIVCVLMMTSGVFVEAARWARLGERAVSDRQDHDTIPVGRRDGDFTAIKIQVRRAAVDVHRVVVHFRNGQQHEAEIRSTIPAGGETRAIDLPGRDRVIDKVEFWYDAKTRGGQSATVVLLGLR